MEAHMQPQDRRIDEWSWSQIDTTAQDDVTSKSKPVDHWAADEKEVLANRDQDNSDSEDDERDVVFEDMQLFFHAIGEPQLIEKFLTNKVTLGQLLEFEEQDLINCGVELVGDRKKILANTAQMHCEKWMPSSLHDMTSKSLLTSPGIYVSLNDMNKHIEYIGVTMKYLKKQIQKKPELLEIGKDYVGVGKVVSELEDLIKTLKTTHNQAHALRHQVKKFLNNPTFRAANHIDSKYIRNAKLRQYTPAIIIASLAVAFSLKFARFLAF